MLEIDQNLKFIFLNFERGDGQAVFSVKKPLPCKTADLYQLHKGCPVCGGRRSRTEGGTASIVWRRRHARPRRRAWRFLLKRHRKFFTRSSNVPAACKGALKFSARTIPRHPAPRLGKGAAASRPFSPVSFAGCPAARKSLPHPFVIRSITEVAGCPAARKSLLPRRAPIMPAARFARFLKRELFFFTNRGGIPMR